MSILPPPPKVSAPPPIAPPPPSVPKVVAGPPKRASTRDSLALLSSQGGLAPAGPPASVPAGLSSPPASPGTVITPLPPSAPGPNSSLRHASPSAGLLGTAKGPSPPKSPVLPPQPSKAVVPKPVGPRPSPSSRPLPPPKEESASGTKPTSETAPSHALEATNAGQSAGTSNPNAASVEPLVHASAPHAVAEGSGSHEVPVAQAIPPSSANSSAIGSPVPKPPLASKPSAPKPDAPNPMPPAGSEDRTAGHPTMPSVQTVVGTPAQVSDPVPAAPASQSIGTASAPVISRQDTAAPVASPAVGSKPPPPRKFVTSNPTKPPPPASPRSISQEQKGGTPDSPRGSLPNAETPPAGVPSGGSPPAPPETALRPPAPPAVAPPVPPPATTAKVAVPAVLKPDEAVKSVIPEVSTGATSSKEISAPSMSTEKSAVTPAVTPGTKPAMAEAKEKVTRPPAPSVPTPSKLLEPTVPKPTSIVKPSVPKAAITTPTAAKAGPTSTEKTLQLASGQPGIQRGVAGEPEKSAAPPVPSILTPAKESSVPSPATTVTPTMPKDAASPTMANEEPASAPEASRAKELEHDTSSPVVVGSAAARVEAVPKNVAEHGEPSKVAVGKASDLKGTARAELKHAGHPSMSDKPSAVSIPKVSGVAVNAKQPIAKPPASFVPKAVSGPKPTTHVSASTNPTGSVSSLRQPVPDVQDINEKTQDKSAADRTVDTPPAQQSSSVPAEGGVDGVTATLPRDIAANHNAGVPAAEQAPQINAGTPPGPALVHAKPSTNTRPTPQAASVSKLPSTASGKPAHPAPAMLKPVVLKPSPVSALNTAVVGKEIVRLARHEDNAGGNITAASEKEPVNHALSTDKPMEDPTPLSAAETLSAVNQLKDGHGSLDSAGSPAPPQVPPRSMATTLESTPQGVKQDAARTPDRASEMMPSASFRSGGAEPNAKTSSDNIPGQLSRTVGEDSVEVNAQPPLEGEHARRSKLAEKETQLYPPTGAPAASVGLNEATEALPQQPQPQSNNNLSNDGAVVDQVSDTGNSATDMRLVHSPAPKAGNEVDFASPADSRRAKGSHSNTEATPNAMPDCVRQGTGAVGPTAAISPQVSQPQTASLAASVCAAVTLPTADVELSSTTLDVRRQGEFDGVATNKMDMPQDQPLEVTVQVPTAGQAKPVTRPNNSVVHSEEAMAIATQTGTITAQFPVGSHAPNGDEGCEPAFASATEGADTKKPSLEVPPSSPGTSLAQETSQSSFSGVQRLAAVQQAAVQVNYTATDRESELRNQVEATKAMLLQEVGASDIKINSLKQQLHVALKRSRSAEVDAARSMIAAATSQARRAGVTVSIAGDATAGKGTLEDSVDVGPLLNVMHTTAADLLATIELQNARNNPSHTPAGHLSSKPIKNLTLTKLEHLAAELQKLRADLAAMQAREDELKAVLLQTEDLERSCVKRLGSLSEEYKCLKQGLVASLHSATTSRETLHDEVKKLDLALSNSDAAKGIADREYALRWQERKAEREQQAASQMKAIQDEWRTWLLNQQEEIVGKANAWLHTLVTSLSNELRTLVTEHALEASVARQCVVDLQRDIATLMFLIQEARRRKAVAWKAARARRSVGLESKLGSEEERPAFAFEDTQYTFDQWVQSLRSDPKSPERTPSLNVTPGTVAGSLVSPLRFSLLDDELWFDKLEQAWRKADVAMRYRLEWMLDLDKRIAFSRHRADVWRALALVIGVRERLGALLSVRRLRQEDSGPHISASQDFWVAENPESHNPDFLEQSPAALRQVLCKHLLSAASPQHTPQADGHLRDLTPIKPAGRSPVNGLLERLTRPRLAETRSQPGRTFEKTLRKALPSSFQGDRSPQPLSPSVMRPTFSWIVQRLKKESFEVPTSPRSPAKVHVKTAPGTPSITPLPTMRADDPGYQSQADMFESFPRDGPAKQAVSEIEKRILERIDAAFTRAGK